MIHITAPYLLEVAEGESSESTTRHESRVPVSGPVVEKKADRRLAIITVLATAAVGIVGVIGTVWASKLSVDASIRNQDVQIKEQRAKEDRDRKADVYLNFQETSNKYTTAINAAKTCILAARDATPVGATSYSVGPECVKDLNDVAPARYSFQGARNRVFVYGSQEAEDQARRIASYLPSARGVDASHGGLPPLDDSFFNYDDAVFDVMYRAFNRIICQEVPPEPRKGCG
jgi:hypothetical protein